MIKKSRIRIVLFGLAAILLLLTALLLFRDSPWQQTQDMPTTAPDATLTAAQGMADQCQKSSSREYCYAGLFSIYTKKYNLDSSLKVLMALQDIDPASRGCHFIAHSISYAEAAKNVKDWKKTLERIPVSLCTGGFVHGVLEAYKNLNPDFVLSANSIDAICDEVKDHANNAGENSCAHIMGHLLMVDNRGDISKVLNVCKDVKESLLYECYAGTFMENETRENLYAHQILPHIPWNQETLAAQRALCGQQTDALAKQACWKELSHMVVFIDKQNPTLVYEYCNDAPTQQAKDDCYGHGIGIIMSSGALSNANMLKLCTPYVDDEQRSYSCMSRAINASLTSSPKYAARTITFCDSFVGQQQEDCYRDIGYRLLKMVPSDTERENLCASAPKMYQDYCQGIGILKSQG